MKIYHNPRCRKSRAGLAYLQEQGIEAEIILYLSKGAPSIDGKNSPPGTSTQSQGAPLSKKVLQTLLMKLNIPASELVRTQEEQYKKELKGRNFNEDEWIKIYLENPKLIRRPIIETKYKAVIGDPVENIEPLL